jgi:hypothetical protein
MHYWHPRGVLKIEPVDRFLQRHPEEMISRHDKTSLIVDSSQLPDMPQITVLNQAR